MLLFLLFVCFLAGLFVFCCILFIAHVGYWQFFSAFFKWFSSLFSSCVLEQMVFALCCSVPITPYFVVNGWWLSHCRKRSVWVGFLNTDVLRLPSLPGVTSISKKGMAPSSLWFSAVNCICWSMELRYSRNPSFWDDCKMVNVSSTNLFHRTGGWGADLRAFFYFSLIVGSDVKTVYVLIE